MTSVNDQITDAMTQINTHILGSAPAQSVGLLDITGAETIGMSMYNAITAQQNSQTAASASATATCAKILQAVAPPPPPAAVPSSEADIDKTAAEVASQILLAQFKKMNKGSGKDFSDDIAKEVEALAKDGSIPGLSSIVGEVSTMLSEGSQSSGSKSGENGAS